MIWSAAAGDGSWPGSATVGTGGVGIEGSCGTTGDGVCGSTGVWTVGGVGGVVVGSGGSTSGWSDGGAASGCGDSGLACGIGGTGRGRGGKWSRIVRAFNVVACCVDAAATVAAVGDADDVWAGADAAGAHELPPSACATSLLPLSRTARTGHGGSVTVSR